MSLQPDNESFYALESLAICKRRIRAAIDLMVSCRPEIEKYLSSDKGKAKTYYDELCLAFSHLSENVSSSVLFLQEVGEDKLASFGKSLFDNLKGFNLMTKDYTALASIMKQYAESLPANDTTNAGIIGRCMNSVKMGFYPTDLENVSHIMGAISFPEGVTTNLLDPCCGEGAALKKLAVGNNCFTYGVELDTSRAEKAQEELHRVGFGSFFHSRISHEAFHIVFLNPPYLAVVNETGKRTRDEKRFLIESIPHLMYGGLLIYIIPYYRLTPDICRIFCDNFADISVHRFTDSEFKQHRQVAVMGTRIKRIDGAEQAELLEWSSYSPEELPCIADIEQGRYVIPAKSKDVATFKGAQFNVLELQRQLGQSGSFDKVITTGKQEEGLRRPPLPFSFSQLGLIGGSGYINGLIDCDQPHIIKGRIVKETQTERTPHKNRKGEVLSTSVREVSSNKMVFNILTPNGFKSLA